LGETESRSVVTNTEAWLSSTGELKITRRLDLTVALDRQEFMAATAMVPGLCSLAEETLDDYLRWFPPGWNVVHSAGFVGGSSQSREHSGLLTQIDRMLIGTAKMRRLQGFPGFGQMVSNLQNSTQVAASLFEIHCAAWCLGRIEHRGLVFEPAVVKRSGVKYPDFLWKTGLGDLYCECKTARVWERRESRRVRTLCEVATEALGDEPWPDDLRLDIDLSGNLGSNPGSRLGAIVAKLAWEVRAGQSPRPIRDGAMTVTIRDRSLESPSSAGSIQVTSFRVGPQPTRVDIANAQVSITRSLAAARTRIVRELVKKAKRQLPEEGPGGVFIETGSPSVADVDKQLKEMLAHPSHRAIVWAAICADGEPRLVAWQEHQPFDNRLLEPNE
jgi:hypothetical protein